MPLVVRLARPSDWPVLETLEQEVSRRFPGRTQWQEAFRELYEDAADHEPDGLIVADYEGRAIGAVVARKRGKHPFTGKQLGRIEALTLAPAWRAHGVAERLLAEAQAYLKGQGCEVLQVSLPADAGADGDLYRQSGFAVAAWELERPL